jgi:hypothetical protein
VPTHNHAWLSCVCAPLYSVITMAEFLEREAYPGHLARTPPPAAAHHGKKAAADSSSGQATSAEAPHTQADGQPVRLRRGFLSMAIVSVCRPAELRVVKVSFFSTRGYQLRSPGNMVTPYLFLFALHRKISPGFTRTPFARLLARLSRARQWRCKSRLLHAQIQRGKHRTFLVTFTFILVVNLSVDVCAFRYFF